MKAVIVLVGLWGIWTSLMVLIGGAGPDVFRWLAWCTMAGGIAGALYLLGLRSGLLLALGIEALVTLWFFMGIQPRHDRNWSEDQSRLPRITRAGEVVTIDNFRRFRYRSKTEWESNWTTERFDLSQLVGADMGVEQFSSLEAVAHTFVSFRFADGRVLVASIEIRKEEHEIFSALKGLFRQYEKMVVLGDERDLVELRVIHRKDTVYLHPLDIRVERVRAFLNAVLDEAAAIDEVPVFYNTFSASCSSSLAAHIRAVEPMRWDPRMVLPGYADGLAHELGWLGEGSLEAIRKRNRIDERARLHRGTDGFSAGIRSAL